MRVCLIISVLALGFPGSGSSEEKPSVIRVIDAESRRPVPLVQLRTTNQVRYFTDNQGVVAIDDPELLNRPAFFHVESHGYEFPRDGFGMQGKRLHLKPGGEAEIKIQRINIAERLYRITGGGKFDHSLRAGLEIPGHEKNQIPKAGVFGCDSVLTAVYGGKLFWIWGDTNRPEYPLGNFHSTGATSLLPWDIEKGIDLQYFENGKGFVRSMAKMPGEGPTWLTGLTVLPDETGKERLGAMYLKVRGFLDVYETGLCEFDPEKGVFQKLFAFEKDQEPRPNGHPFRFEDDQGMEWMVYADPLPTMKIPASYKAWKDPKSYERIETKSEFKAPESGDTVKPHRGTIAWNEYRKRWIMIFTETKGLGGEPSRLGESWYAESESPFGPWNRCAKVVSHSHYSFYNPKQHPYFVSEGGKVIYFEGTYTAMFSTAGVPTPRYDYNQILYRLDLGDPRLAAARVRKR